MGKFADLTSEERSLLTKLYEAHHGSGISDWLLVSAGRSASLLASYRNDHGIDDVPRQHSFYTGLAQRGYLSVGYSPRGTLNFTIQASVVDFGRYQSKPPAIRWLLDRHDDLLHEKTVTAKLFWTVLGYVLGFVSAILLRLLGWVKIGA